MQHQAIANDSLEAAPVRGWSDPLRAEGGETGDFRFAAAPRPAKLQFAPHRIVGSYADYRSLGARKGWLFG